MCTHLTYPVSTNSCSPLHHHHHRNNKLNRVPLKLVQSTSKQLFPKWSICDDCFIVTTITLIVVWHDIGRLLNPKDVYSALCFTVWQSVRQATMFSLFQFVCSSLAEQKISIPQFVYRLLGFLLYPPPPNKYLKMSYNNSYLLPSAVFENSREADWYYVGSRYYNYVFSTHFASASCRLLFLLLSSFG